jgi:hypothetical protein
VSSKRREPAEAMWPAEYMTATSGDTESCTKRYRRPPIAYQYAYDLDDEPYASATTWHEQIDLDFRRLYTPTSQGAAPANIELRTAIDCRSCNCVAVGSMEALRYLVIEYTISMMKCVVYNPPRPLRCILERKILQRQHTLRTEVIQATRVRLHCFRAEHALLRYGAPS